MIAMVSSMSQNEMNVDHPHQYKILQMIHSYNVIKDTSNTNKHGDAMNIYVWNTKAATLV